jgi:hypothetical protein
MDGRVYGGYGRCVLATSELISIIRERETRDVLNRNEGDRATVSPSGRA